MILGLKRILEYSVNIRIFGYSNMILNIRIIVSKEIHIWHEYVEYINLLDPIPIIKSFQVILFLYCNNVAY